jgi:hypothetical protein
MEEKPRSSNSLISRIIYLNLPMWLHYMYISPILLNIILMHEIAWTPGGALSAPEIFKNQEVMAPSLNAHHSLHSSTRQISLPLREVVACKNNAGVSLYVTICLRVQALLDAKIKWVSWGNRPLCSNYIRDFRFEDGCRMFPRNTGIHRQNYTVSEPKRPQH